MVERFNLVAVVSRGMGHSEKIIFTRKIGPCSKDEAIRKATEIVGRDEMPAAAEYWLVPLAESRTHSRLILSSRIRAQR